MEQDYKKKLIEIALPLPEINDASAYDKLPGIGHHPKGVHQWWARLPLPVARAILFASVVDDPSVDPQKWTTEEKQDQERERLFDILRNLMQKRLHESPEVYQQALIEMNKHSEGKLPAVYDPFSGGGTIPLEANRMGFEALASDINPVAVLLNRWNLEFAPRWHDHPPINPRDFSKLRGKEEWRGTDGLAVDLEYYGDVIFERAYKKLTTSERLYPSVTLSNDYKGQKASVVAWIWARTVKSPNPAFGDTHVPLLRTYWLSNTKGKEVWLNPVVDFNALTYKFEICTDTSLKSFDAKEISSGTKLGKNGYRCIFSNEPISTKYIKEQGLKCAFGIKLVAIVVKIRSGKIYLPATDFHENSASRAEPRKFPDIEIPEESFGIKKYGISKFSELFTPRQLYAITTFSDLIVELKDEIIADCLNAELKEEEVNDYVKTITLLLGFTLDRCADFNNMCCRWVPSNQKSMQIFSAQWVPWLSDFAEANILGSSVGSWKKCFEYISKCVKVSGSCNSSIGKVVQIDASKEIDFDKKYMVSTDPPYYNNIGYAALSDFYYIWLRKILKSFSFEECNTILVPKIGELTATKERFGGNSIRAKRHFEEGFNLTFQHLRKIIDQRFPLTVFYAYKQSDNVVKVQTDKGEKIINKTTGWETLLKTLISCGFQITGTWPVRASQKWRMVAIESNALMSYIVLVCRPRIKTISSISSNQFRQELKLLLPSALRQLQQGNIAPVDFAQAAIGPGMSVYSKYEKIIDTSGKVITVRDALEVINKTLTEVISEVEDNFDAETRWAISWFEQHGFSEGEYGDAEVLSKAKDINIDTLVDSELLLSERGKVRLLSPEELTDNLEKNRKNFRTVWEMTHHILRKFCFEQVGELETAKLLNIFGNNVGLARELAYRLHDICERKVLPNEAKWYNTLVIYWPNLSKRAKEEDIFSQNNLINSGV